MFAELQPGLKRRGFALLFSLVLHAVALAVLLYRPPAIFVRPSFVTIGASGRPVSPLYLPRTAEQATSPPESARVLLKSAHTLRSKHSAKISRPRIDNSKTADDLAQQARAGSPFGSTPDGPSDGHDIRPAFPIVFPDPMISRSDIPAGIEGRVIVEVTIDTQGNVIDTRLVQGLGYGIEDKVISTLQTWRFKPATRDGVAIASQQDVSFHFPG